jgi:hypothetical protein
MDAASIVQASGAAAQRSISHDVWIGIAATALAVGAMVDELLGSGTDDDGSGPLDPFAFALAIG